MRIWYRTLHAKTVRSNRCCTGQESCVCGVHAFVIKGSSSKQSTWFYLCAGQKSCVCGVRVFVIKGSWFYFCAQGKAVRGAFGREGNASTAAALPLGQRPPKRMQR